MFFRKAVKNYLLFSAGSAACGSAIGTLVVLNGFVAPSIYKEGAAKEENANFPKRVCNGLEEVGRCTGEFALKGAVIGGAPVTYPLFKAYTCFSEIQQRNKNEKNSVPSHQSTKKMR